MGGSALRLGSTASSDTASPTRPSTRCWRPKAAVVPSVGRRIQGRITASGTSTMTMRAARVPLPTRPRVASACAASCAGRATPALVSSRTTPPTSRPPSAICESRSPPLPGAGLPNPHGGTPVSESCESCRFSAPPVRPDKWHELQCRRIPPVQSVRPEAQWPNIYREGWCGEYEARPAEASKPARKPRPTAGDVETRSEQG